MAEGYVTVVIKADTYEAARDLAERVGGLVMYGSYLELPRLVPPRLTTSQRDTLTGLQEGEIIYNKTTKSLQMYDGSGWVQM